MDESDDQRRKRSIRFPPELDARLESLAVEHDRDFSWIVIRGLEHALDGGKVSEWISRRAS
jgi:predicted transcriptional regulator